MDFSEKDQNWHYADKSGRLKPGWLRDGECYYLDSSSCAMHKATWLNEGGAIYHFNTPIRWGDMLQRAQQYGSRTSWPLLVDTSSYRTGIYSRVSGVWAHYYEWDCSLSAPDTSTPKGE